MQSFYTLRHNNIYKYLSDEDAFCEYVLRNLDSCPIKYMIDESKREDFLQELSLKLFINKTTLFSIYQIDGENNAFAWVRRVAYNSAIDYIKKHKIYNHEDEIPNTGSDSINSKYYVSHIVGVSNKILSRRQNEIFELHFVQEMEAKDVAESLAMPLATIYWHIGKIKMTLRKFKKFFY